MQNIDSNKDTNAFDDDIDFRELFYVLLAGKWIIFSFTAFVSISAVIYSLLLPNIYESKALLVPVSPSNNISGTIGRYSSLAGITGANLGYGNDEGNSLKALEKIGSLSFFENNILSNINLQDLMAIKDWNHENNTLTYDDNIYDVKSNTWVRDYSYPQQQIPSAQESYDIFKEKHLSLNQDLESGFITLSIKHQSPYIAKQWNELIVREVNEFFRQKDKLESEKAVSYLNKQILMTSLSEIKEALAELLQEKTKKLTLIEANEFYVFDYIDPPAVMELKAEPKRALICILSAIFGGIFSIFFVLIRYFFNDKSS